MHPLPALTLPLVTLLVIIAGTALLSGGFSVARSNPAAWGGKNYFYLVGAVVGYFVLSHRRFPAPGPGFMSPFSCRNHGRRPARGEFVRGQGG